MFDRFLHIIVIQLQSLWTMRGMSASDTLSDFDITNTLWGDPVWHCIRVSSKERHAESVLDSALVCYGYSDISTNVLRFNIERGWKYITSWLACFRSVQVRLGSRGKAYINLAASAPVRVATKAVGAFGAWNAAARVHPAVSTALHYH